MSPRLSTDGVVVIAGLTATHVGVGKGFIVFPDNCLAWPRAILSFGETCQDGMVWAVSRRGEVCSSLVALWSCPSLGPGFRARHRYVTLVMSLNQPSGSSSAEE